MFEIEQQRRVVVVFTLVCDIRLVGNWRGKRSGRSMQLPLEGVSCLFTLRLLLLFFYCCFSYVHSRVDVLGPPTRNQSIKQNSLRLR